MFSIGMFSSADGPNALYTSWVENPWIMIIAVVIAYLIGNISPSILISKAKGIDIRNEGSGNAGTTNALRVMGKKAGAVTLIVDVLKGTGAVLIGWLLAGSPGAMWCVIAVFCGHVWPVFFGFKGGKGVATAFGAFLGLNPVLALATLGVVAVFVLISKRMSVGSVMGAVCFPVLTFFLERDFVIPGVILALIVIIKHRSNIGRILRGEEPVMSIFKK